MLRIMASFGIATSMVCFVWFVLQAPISVEGEDFSGVEVVCEAADSGPFAVGKARIWLSVRNPTNRSIKVVGFLENCTVRACLKSSEPLDTPIPAKSERRISLDLVIREAGPFEVPCEIYIDAGELLVRSTNIVGIAEEK